MRKSTAFSIEEKLLQWLALESKRTDRSKSWIVNNLIKKAAIAGTPTSPAPAKKQPIKRG